MNIIIKGRGAQIAPHNRFQKHEYEREDEYLEHCAKEGDEVESLRTKFIEVFPKTLINKVNSPDLRMMLSMNPYQGCEHGCVYCYARNTHEFWGYSAGLDFEKVILVKKNAPELLRKELQKRSHAPHSIMLSGNTDCYQPAERRFGITRALLQILLQHKHPVGIITKNALVLRDLDILREMAAMNLVVISISITTLNEDLRRVMEPRTASAKRKLDVVRQLSCAGIPVNVMMAPMIPSLTSHEIFPLLKAVSEAGASSAHYTMARLNGQIASIFADWIERHFPDRAKRVLHEIAACHGGKLNDSRYGTRMRGEGEVAKVIARTFQIARSRYGLDRKIPDLCTELFDPMPGGQMKMF